MHPVCSHSDCPEAPIFEILPRASAPGAPVQACPAHVGALLTLDPEAEGPHEWLVSLIVQPAPAAEG